MNALTAIVSICAVLVSATVLREHVTRAQSARVETGLDTVSVSNWRDFAVRGRRLGSTAAPVTLVVFSDFQCPYCRSFAAHLRALRARYQDSLAVVFRHFPLPYHVLAKVASGAAECAGEQDRFWEYHDLLFEKQDSLGGLGWIELASRSDVRDTIAFRTCLATGRFNTVIAIDSADAAPLHLHGTPGILINQILLDGLLPLPLLDSLVQNQMRNGRIIR